ncbi:MAG: hypothetical protein EHM12_12540, partial [Dehalococcoidia bacterium]
MKLGDFMHRLGLIALFLFIFSGAAYSTDVANCQTIATTGSYVLTANLFNNSGSCLQFNANDSTLNCNGYTVEAIGAAYDAIRFTNVHNVTLLNCITKSARYGLHITSTAVSYNMTVNNFTAYNHSNSGLYMTNGDNLTITNAYTYNNSQNGFTFYMPTTNLLIINATAENLTYGTGIGFNIQQANKAVLINITTINCTNGLNLSKITNNANATVYNSTISGNTYDAVLDNATELYLVNTSYSPAKIKFFNTAFVFKQNYVRLNFTSNGAADNANFQANNSQGIVKNATASGGFSAWFLVNDTKQTSSANTTYNVHTVYSYPALAGYVMNTSILSFTTTGTWNITFYPQAPPVISSVVNGSITNITAQINWTTTTASNSSVFFGTSSGTYTNSTGQNDSVTSHNVNLTGLSKLTTYFYLVQSCDLAGSCTNSSEYSFTTLDQPNIYAPTITAPTITPASPGLTDTLTCNNGTFTDADGNTEARRYFNWWWNGQPLTFVPDADTVFYLPMDEMRGAIAKD